MDFVAHGSLLILYSGETGNAEEIAYEVQTKLPVQTVVRSMDQYNILDLPSERMVVFIVSTTGDGDPPETMRAFWAFLLRKSLASDALIGLKFSVFGLGDSSYDKYNAVARKLSKRLVMIGATEAVPLALGDDQSPFGYLSAFYPWLDGLLDHLSKRGIPPVLPSVAALYSLQMLDNSSTIEISTIPPSRFGATVTTNRRLTAPSWAQDVRHIQLTVTRKQHIEQAPIYQLGDVAVVHYRNAPELVAQAAAMIIEGCRLHCGVDITLDTALSITLTTQAGAAPRPSRLGSVSSCTLRTLLERFLDIGAVPKRSYFAKLAQYATDPEEAEKLLELASPQGTDLYFDYCIRERKSYVEVLQEFRSCRPPLSALLEVIQVIAPRRYSIASSPTAQPDKVDLCVAVATRRTPYGRKRTGLCSGFLASLQVGDVLEVEFKRGSIFNTPIAPPPPHPVPPLILVGPGTGVAPMRSLIQHHCRTRSAGSDHALEDRGVPRMLLFFGCRKQERDCLYSEEWDALNADLDPYSEEQPACKGVRVITAFSQDQLVKNYVTHKIKENAQVVCAMLVQGAAIFVAGSSKKMPADVHKAFSAALQDAAEMSEEQSLAFLAKLAREKKYIVEAW